MMKEFHSSLCEKFIARVKINLSVMEKNNQVLYPYMKINSSSVSKIRIGPTENHERMHLKRKLSVLHFTCSGL